MLQIKHFLCYVVKKKFRYSFVLPKKYSVREINNFPKHYKSLFEGNSLYINLIKFSECYLEM